MTAEILSIGVLSVALILTFVMSIRLVSITILRLTTMSGDCTRNIVSSNLSHIHMCTYNGRRASHSAWLRLQASASHPSAKIIVRSLGKDVKAM